MTSSNPPPPTHTRITIKTSLSIKEIEHEMSRTQKNKATEYHLGQLKAKLAKLRTQLQEPAKGAGGGAGDGFEVQKYGDGRVALIGFPSVGKSTLLTVLTGTASEAAAYEFTTLTCIPGVIRYNDAKIQLLDLPGIIEGAADGKGRGRQVIAVCKSADLLLMVLDASRPAAHRAILTRELEAVGMRLNRRPPRIYFKKKKTGGIAFNATVPLTRGMDQSLCQRILQEYKIHNAEVLFREDCGADELIDVIEGNRYELFFGFFFWGSPPLSTRPPDEREREAHPGQKNATTATTATTKLEYQSGGTSSASTSTTRSTSAPSRKWTPSPASPTRCPSRPRRSSTSTRCSRACGRRWRSCASTRRRWAASPTSRTPWC